MNDITTTDFSRFGHRERVKAQELLTAWNENGLPYDFYDQDVTIMLNTHSENVFLTNSDYQVAMINYETGKLESFYSTPYEGIEGFWDELVEQYKDMHPEDQEYIRGIAKENGYELPELED